METPSLQEVEQRVVQLAARIGASASALPTFGYSDDGARPHIEVDASGVHYVVTERGAELERVTSHDLDEILWHVFRSVTFSLAIDYELAHRDEQKDSRRLMFSRQVELLEMLSLEWSERQAHHHQEILAKHPFDDCSSARTKLTVELRGAGHSAEDAWHRACRF